MARSLSPGRFISLEGGEGVGKSTQAKALARALRDRGHDVVETREPGGSDGAEAIRRLLLDGAEDRWNAQAEALLFAAARADHVAKTIRPALAAGQWVVTDRYLDSSLAYQGGASGVSVAQLMALHEIGSAGLLPDDTFLLALPFEEAQQRATMRDRAGADRFGRRDPAYHARVAASFAAMAQNNPDRFRIIDASGDAASITQRLLAAIDDL